MGRLVSILVMLVLLTACTPPRAQRQEEVLVGVSGSNNAPVATQSAAGSPAAASTQQQAAPQGVNPEQYVASYIATINANEPRVEPQKYPTLKPNMSIDLRLEETVTFDVMLPIKPGDSGGKGVTIDVHWDRHKVEIPGSEPVYVDGYRAILIDNNIIMLRAFAPFSETPDEVFPGILVVGKTVHFFREAMGDACAFPENFDVIGPYATVLSFERHIYPGMGYNGTITLTPDSGQDVVVDVAGLTMSWGEQVARASENRVVWMEVDNCRGIRQFQTLSGAPYISYPADGWTVNLNKSVVWFDPGK